MYNCYHLQTLAEGCMAQKMGLHPVVAPIRDQKNASKCQQNYHLGDLKIIFFWGGGTAPSPAPHHVDVSPPPSEILNTPLRTLMRLSPRSKDTERHQYVMTQFGVLLARTVLIQQAVSVYKSIHVILWSKWNTEEVATSKQFIDELIRRHGDSTSSPETEGKQHICTVYWIIHATCKNE